MQCRLSDRISYISTLCLTNFSEAETFHQTSLKISLDFFPESNILPARCQHNNLEMYQIYLKMSPDVPKGVNQIHIKLTPDLPQNINRFTSKFYQWYVKNSTLHTSRCHQIYLEMSPYFPMNFTIFPARYHHISSRFHHISLKMSPKFA